MSPRDLNMLLWLGLAVVALAGKFIYERWVTRAEKQQAPKRVSKVGQPEEASTNPAAP